MGSSKECSNMALIFSIFGMKFHLALDLIPSYKSSSWHSIHFLIIKFLTTSLTITFEIRMRCSAVNIKHKYIVIMILVHSVCFGLISCCLVDVVWLWFKLSLSFSLLWFVLPYQICSRYTACQIKFFYSDVSNIEEQSISNWFEIYIWLTTSLYFLLWSIIWLLISRFWNFSYLTWIAIIIYILQNICFIFSFSLHYFLKHLFRYIFIFYYYFGGGGVLFCIVLTARQGLRICQIDSHSTPWRDWKSCWWSSATSSTFCSCWKKPWIKKI